MCATEVAALLRPPRKPVGDAAAEPVPRFASAPPTAASMPPAAAPMLPAPVPVPPSAARHGPRPHAPDKAAIDDLPPFPSMRQERIVVPQSAADFAAAADALLREQYVGFDTESKPTFVKGEAATGPHVVQFATAERAYLFQVHRSEGRDALAAVLGSTALVKVGFGLRSDRGHIRARLGAPLNAVLDLTTWFHTQGYRNEIGVRTAIAIVMGQRFVKSKRWSTSNWAAATLSEGQCLYAANDAWGAIAVLNALLAQGVREVDLPVIERSA